MYTHIGIYVRSAIITFSIIHIVVSCIIVINIIISSNSNIHVIQAYTQFAIQDSCLFGPNPWKVLAPPSN